MPAGPFDAGGTYGRPVSRHSTSPAKGRSMKMKGGAKSKKAGGIRTQFTKAICSKR